MKKTTISITLVKGDDGRYVGKTYSDRWNIDTVRRWRGVTPDNAGFKEYRDYVRGLGFTVSSAKAGTAPQWRKTVAEFTATLCRPLAHRVQALKDRAA